MNPTTFRTKNQKANRRRFQPRVSIQKTTLLKIIQPAQLRSATNLLQAAFPKHFVEQHGARR